MRFSTVLKTAIIFPMSSYSTLLIMALAAILLSGCNAFHFWNADQKRKAWENGKDFCGKSNFEKFINTPIDDINVRDLLPEKYRLRIHDPRPIPPPGSEFVFTADLRYNRLNIYVDKTGSIESLDCG